ncbi:MAG TPA: peptidase S10, partial [Parachlamydiaceae bacterium]|nr:peptidase S10 [Parachlamydiaceae bacterium]
KEPEAKGDFLVKKEAPKEESVITGHSIKIGNADISYQTSVGTQLLIDDQGNPKASIFYVAYTKDDSGVTRNRPITFCFNGGPGSASVWLHLGVLGPKRVDMDEQGKVAKQPFHLVDNNFSILDMTDLVFIDPVSTGYSRAIPGEDAKQYHGVEKDIQSVAEFIRLYITRNERWESPKFLAGESYGTTRAAGLALELHDTHHLYLDGVMLISSVLNFQTLYARPGNDLPFILFLPTYAATALYHNRLDANLQQDVKKTLAEVEEFAFGDYAEALMHGDRLDKEKRKNVLDKLVQYTGIDRDYIDRSDLRIPIFRFAKEVLRNERSTVGRFDSRLKGIDTDLCSSTFEFDPSFENIVGAFTATFNNYIRSDLKWKRDEEYKIIADVQPWDFGSATNEFLDVGDKLRMVMSKNTMLEVFVASGYFDLATPYFATEYTFSHLGIDPSLKNNVTIEVYEGGHMMYLYYPSLVKLKTDIAHFMKQRLDKRT